MKTWQFWVIVLLVIFVVVPLIYYAITANTLGKVVAQNPQLLEDKCSGPLPSFTNPGPGKSWQCDKQNGWQLVNT